MTGTRRSALSVREDLAGLEPYVSPQQEARYQLNTNESPYDVPDAIMDEVTRELGSARLNRYPDKDASALLAALADLT
ncbi:MAG: histidinol-phosphate transaminase, partial [Actinomycetota bacterium]